MFGRSGCQSLMVLKEEEVEEEVRWGRSRWQRGGRGDEMIGGEARRRSRRSFSRFPCTGGRYLRLQGTEMATKTACRAWVWENPGQEVKPGSDQPSARACVSLSYCHPLCLVSKSQRTAATQPPASETRQPLNNMQVPPKSRPRPHQGSTAGPAAGRDRPPPL